MTVELGSVLGAITLALIAVVGWAGPRWTKEGRLLAHIRRLGEAHALLPESGERARLGAAMTELARELNVWNGADQRAARRWRIGAVIGALLISYGVVIWVSLAMSLAVGTLWVGALIVGAVAGALAVVVSEIAERAIARRATAKDREVREHAFRQGKPLESN